MKAFVLSVHWPSIISNSFSLSIPDKCLVCKGMNITCVNKTVATRFEISITHSKLFFQTALSLSPAVDEFCTYSNEFSVIFQSHNASTNSKKAYEGVEPNKCKHTQVLCIWRALGFVQQKTGCLKTRALARLRLGKSNNILDLCTSNSCETTKP